MGIETPADFGGSESSFTSAIIAIEELAKVDPSVSVMCDVHNTLVNTVIRKYGTKEQQEKFLPQLAQTSVSISISALNTETHEFERSEASACLSLPQVRTLSRFRLVQSRRATIG